MINVALIGHGYWGKILEKYITPTFNLRYVCDSKSDLRMVWEDKDVGAVIIAVRNEQRYGITRDALLSGKNVLSEKPLALTYAEACELRATAGRHKRELVTDYTFTQSRLIQTAMGLIKDERIGSLQGVDMRVDHLGPFGGGDAYWLLGSHMLSVLDMFYPLHELSFRKQDIVQQNGVTETGIILLHGEINGQIHLSLNYPAKRVEVVLYGSDGTMVYNPREEYPLVVTTYERGSWNRDVNKEARNYSGDESNNLKYVMDYFNRVLLGNAESNIGTAVEITRILEELQCQE